LAHFPSLFVVDVPSKNEGSNDGEKQNGNQQNSFLLSIESRRSIGNIIFVVLVDSNFSSL
jgi:hypothetical protein